MKSFTNCGICYKFCCDLAKPSIMGNYFKTWQFAREKYPQIVLRFNSVHNLSYLKKPSPLWALRLWPISPHWIQCAQLFSKSFDHVSVFQLCMFELNPCYIPFTVTMISFKQNILLSLLYTCTTQMECYSMSYLTHWGRNKMAAVMQTTYLNAFSQMKMWGFWYNAFWPTAPCHYLN